MGTTTFVASDHPRSRDGRWAPKSNAAPIGTLEEPAVYDDEQDEVLSLDAGEWERAGEEWAAAAAAGEITEPDAEAGSRAAWVSSERPF